MIYPGSEKTTITPQPWLLPAACAPGQDLIPSFCRNHCLKPTRTPFGPGGFGKSASPSPGLSSWGAALTPADRPARGRGGWKTGGGSSLHPITFQPVLAPHSHICLVEKWVGPKEQIYWSPAPWAPSQPLGIGARTRMNVFGSRLSP